VVSACGSAAAERFARGSPSAHTPVFFVKPAARSGFCSSDLSAFGIPQAGDRVGLEHCAALASQAWSTRNLDGVASSLGGTWAMQARQPTVAGSAVTGASLFSGKLDQIWTATVTGTPPQQQLVQLRPVDDTALCLTLPAAEAAGVRLVLAVCDGAANQDFMGIAFFFSASSPYFITTPDSRFCVQAAAIGPADTRNIVIARCTGNNRDVWNTELGLVRYFASQYAELYAGSGPLEYSMTVSGHGVPGSGILVEPDAQLAAQVWTDLAPGQVEPEGNADGSITLRPLSAESLCLTVPNAHYAAGVQLTVQTCDGAVSQEFLRSGTPIVNSQELIAFGDGRFCVGEPGAVGPAARWSSSPATSKPARPGSSITGGVAGQAWPRATSSPTRSTGLW